MVISWCWHWHCLWVLVSYTVLPMFRRNILLPYTRSTWMVLLTVSTHFCSKDSDTIFLWPIGKTVGFHVVPTFQGTNNTQRIERTHKNLIQNSYFFQLHLLGCWARYEINYIYMFIDLNYQFYFKQDFLLEGILFTLDLYLSQVVS